MTEPKPLRVALMAHADEPLHAEGVARWLAQHEELCALVLVEDPPAARRRRLRWEYRRTGALGMLDVLAWRIYHRAFHGGELRRAREELQRSLSAAPPLRRDLPVLRTSSPNSVETQAFLREAAPDAMVALVKHILKPAVFAVPTQGTFVWHPGICPEYRNAHGCFWAIARGDLDRVGMTLLRIDEGVDTGPVFGYFSLPRSDWSPSPMALQLQVVLRNLPQLLELMRAVAAGSAAPIDVRDRESAVWGQPRLTSWLRRPRPQGATR